MARLALMYLCLRRARAEDIKILRNKRRTMRRADKAFSLTDEEFFGHYRVSKELFDEIFEDIRPYMPAQRRVSEISPKYKTLVALSFFATGSYQRSVGGTYGTPMSQQSVSRAIRDVIEALNNANVVQKHIKFPQTLVERNIIKRRFYEKFNIPAVVGCIDGTHIAIIKPHDNEEKFFNKKYHSRNVQIICDADLNVLSVDASFGGATHDSVIWNQHPIKTHLSELVRNEEIAYFLGDSAYPQRDYMMTPIVDAVPGSPEVYYNRLHGTALNTIEKTIDVIKNRWQCLLGHRALHYHPDVASKIVIACCVLHNICNRNQLTQNIDEHTPESDGIEQPFTEEENAELQRGLQKRYQLVQYLWEVGNR